LSEEVGKEGVKKKDNTTVTWTVVDCNSSSSREHLQPLCGELFGLIVGLPIKNGDPDLLRLWLTLYPVNFEMHLNNMNAACLRMNHKFQVITEHEYVRFWGMYLTSRQYSKRGKNLWGSEPEGIRCAPSYDRFMPH
jgi:hypothetical protein